MIILILVIFLDIILKTLDIIYFKKQETIVIFDKVEIFRTILENIKESKEEILISMPKIEDNEIIDEIIKANNRNVNINITTINQPTIQTLIKNKINLNFINNKSLNNKFAIFDNKIIIIGSNNWTVKGLYLNRENILKSKNSEIIAEYKEYFLKNLIGINS